MKIRNIIILVLLSISASAFSTTNMQLLYGNFDGESYIYDTKNGGKTTFTLEHFSANEIGSIYAFIDYAVADDKFKYHDDGYDFYGEISPRISLSYLSNAELSYGILKDIYIAGEYNRGETTGYDAYLYGLGVDLDLYGFDNFGLNAYVKYQNIGEDTYQLTGFYSSKIVDSNFYFTGYFDWTTLDFTTQNQFLYNFYTLNGAPKMYVGVEWLVFDEKPSATNFNTHVKTNVAQIMLKVEW